MYRKVFYGWRRAKLMLLRFLNIICGCFLFVSWNSKAALAYKKLCNVKKIINTVKKLYILSSVKELYRIGIDQILDWTFWDVIVDCVSIWIIYKLYISKVKMELQDFLLLLLFKVASHRSPLSQGRCLSRSNLKNVFKTVAYVMVIGLNQKLQLRNLRSN